MSKILQNIANHVEFSKEQHMLCFNDFLRAHFEAGRRFGQLLKHIVRSIQCLTLQILHTNSFRLRVNRSNIAQYEFYIRRKCLSFTPLAVDSSREDW